MTKTILTALFGIAILVGGLYLGKYYSDKIPPYESTPIDRDQVTENRAVIAQGKIEPLGGIYNVFAPQGQTVDQYLRNRSQESFAEGVKVQKGDELVRLSGHALLEQQLQLARARANDAIKELDVQIATAKLTLRAAKLAKKEAEFKLAQVEANKDQTLNQKKLDNARKKLDRLKRLAEDPDTRKLISQQQVLDQQLEFETAELELEKANDQIEKAEQAATFAVEAAQQNVADAEQALTDAENLKQNPPESLEAARKLAETQFQASRILSPIDGEVIKVFVREGESPVNTPLLQIGNLSQMQCVAEVSDRMVQHVKVGCQAKLSSPVFGDQVLSGTVIRVDNFVGDPSLPLANPLGMVDKKQSMSSSESIKSTPIWPAT